MAYKSLSELPRGSDVANEDLVMITDASDKTAGRNGTTKVVSIADLVRNAVYSVDADVIVKCSHCGQWGAVKTACKTCGAPVDPPSY